MDDLAMFGELETAPGNRLVVRAVGYLLGSAEGWFHHGGLAAVFPAFTTEHIKLAELFQAIPPGQACLGIDFYTGEVKVINAIPMQEPEVKHSLTLAELIKLVTNAE